MVLEWGGGDGERGVTWIGGGGAAIHGGGPLGCLGRGPSNYFKAQRSICLFYRSFIF